MKTNDKTQNPNYVTSVIEKGIIKSNSLGTFPRENGSKVELYQVEFTTGPNTGKLFCGDWFTKNSTGDEKASLEIGMEVVCYVDIYLNTKVDAKSKYTTFVTLGKGQTTNNDNDDVIEGWLNKGI